MRSAIAAAIVLVSVLAFGALLGVAWAALAPGVVLIVASDGKAYPQGYQPEGYATDAGIAALLCIAAGLVVGLAAVWICKRALPAERALPVALVSVIVLGIAGSAALWWTGERLGGFDLSAVLAAAAEGDEIVAPLRLRMPGVLVLWPMASVLVVFLAALIDWLRGRDGSVR